VLRRAIGYSYVLGLVIVGVLIATYMAGPAFDISSNVGSPFRAFIFAFVIYLGLRIFLGDKRASPSDPYSGYGMVGVVS
jgi:hypothetical protein